MRKRSQYQNRRNRLKTSIPTLILMILGLLCILYFGGSASDNIAMLFVPQSPVSDDPGETPADDSLQMPPPPIALKSGTIMMQANQATSRLILDIIANAHQNPKGQSAH